MAKITEYSIAWGYGAEKLIIMVRAYMKEGWQPLGSPQHIYFPHTSDAHPFEWESYQTMVKYEKETSDSNFDNNYESHHL